MCGGGGGVIGGLLNAVFGKPKEPDLPDPQPVVPPALETDPSKDPETAKRAAAARKRQLAAMRKTQTVYTGEQGLGTAATTAKKTLLGG